MSGSDLLLTCSDCGQEFVFTAGEQQFFQERGYSSPRRCKPCRQAKQGRRRRWRPRSTPTPSTRRLQRLVRGRPRYEHGHNRGLRQLRTNHDGAI
jgi:hypothetical protein